MNRKKGGKGERNGSLERKNVRPELLRGSNKLRRDVKNVKKNKLQRKPPINKLELTLVKIMKRKTKRNKMAMIMKKKDQPEVVEVAEEPGARKWSIDVKESLAHQPRSMTKHML